MHRFCPGRKKEPVEGESCSGCERDFSRPDVDAGDGASQAQVDGVVRIEAQRVKSDPFLWRTACKIVLGEVGPIDRRSVVAAEHDDFAAVFLPSQHFRSGEPGSAAADDHDSIGPA